MFKGFLESVLNGLEFVHVYLDELEVYSNTMREHGEQLWRVFRLIK